MLLLLYSYIITLKIIIIKLILQHQNYYYCIRVIITTISKLLLSHPNYYHFIQYYQIKAIIITFKISHSKYHIQNIASKLSHSKYRIQIIIIAFKLSHPNYYRHTKL